MNASFFFSTVIELIKSKILKESKISHVNRLDELRPSSQRRSLRIWSAVDVLSAKNEIPVRSLIHNAIAELDIEELELFSIHLQFWNREGLVELSESMKSFIKKIRLQSKLPKVLNWLLFDAKPPSKKVIKDISDRRSELFFILSLLRAQELKINNSNELVLLIKSTFSFYGLDSLLGILIKSSITIELPKLSLKCLGKLGKKVQIAILGNKKIARDICSTRLVKSLKKNPHKYDLTPESLALTNFFNNKLLPFIHGEHTSYGSFTGTYSKRDIKANVDAVFSDPKRRRILNKTFLEKKLTIHLFQLRLEWLLLSSRRCRLTYLKELKEEDRKYLWETLSIGYQAELLAECKNRKTLICFLDDIYLNPAIRKDLLCYSKYYRHPSSDIGNHKVLDCEIYSKITTDELEYLFINDRHRLWKLEKTVYKSDTFSVFIDKCLMQASGSGDYPFERLLSIISSYGSVQNMQSLLHTEVSGGKKFWEYSCEQKRYKRKYWELIRAYAPELKEQFYRMEARIALKNKNFSNDLESVLTGKEIPAVLKLSQGSYPFLIQYVQDAFANSSLKAVAYELALRFSIRDAAYLYYLCSLRWKNKDSIPCGHQFDVLYHTHNLPKKSGGNRLITAPEERLKRLQKKILRNGFERMEVDDCAHGFKQGRSILTNAEVHVGQRCVVNVDIQSFFPNTNYKLILKAISQLFDGDLSPSARYALADICSYSGGLPMGAPTSPAIANLVLKSTDQSIANYSKKYGIRYTRYADDLTFSSNAHPAKMIPFVEKVLGQIGYQLDPKKTNIFRRGRRQMVTGLVVNEKPNIPRRIRKRLRAAVHKKSMGKAIHWHGKPMSEESLMGHLNWLQSVQPKESMRYKKILNKI